uniref:Calcium voltage-gated channel auxiliary subunit gamma 6 n=1 Tax=Ornithorhynchus anatinus TaxID=9258 RepID=A0A6I8PB77_ORNAN
MMWSNFFLQEEERRRRGGGLRGARGKRGPGLAPALEGQIKLALLLTGVGATLAVLAVGTEFWVELNTYRANGSAVCEAAHLGLWKVCAKRLWQEDVPSGRATCGPAELPGGVLLLVSLEVFRHAVRGLLEGATPTPAPALEYEYSWSVACALAAGTVLFLGGGCFLLLALPPRPWKAPCLRRGDGDT